jgi:hypothetical protein
MEKGTRPLLQAHLGIYAMLFASISDLYSGMPMVENEVGHLGKITQKRPNMSS